MRVLIVKTTSMGDVVHACAAVSDLARHVPGIEIDWLVEAPFAAIPQMHAGVRKVIPLRWRKWRKSLWRADTRAAIREVIAELRAARYDLVLDLQGLVKSAWWARRAGAPVAGYDRASLREPLAAWAYRLTASSAAQSAGGGALPAAGGGPHGLSHCPPMRPTSPCSLALPRGCPRRPVRCSSPAPAASKSAGPRTTGGR